VKEIGTPFDATQAMRWFRRSAELGNVEAMNSVGLRYERGEGGVTKDLATAFKWYALAADHGDLNGMTNTANCCAAGTGTPVDGPRAERLYLAAIRRFVLPADRQKLANAEFSLACLYVNPKANVLDPTRAIVAAERAAANGNPKAWAVLGSAAGHGVGLPKDPPAAFGYYRKGAEAGDPLAMLGLGQCYQSGIGCAMDFGEANVWYTKAANAGSTDAMVELGIMHVQGTPTDADFQAAAAWYRKAADLGSALATGNLAILMANGQGMPQDPETALVLARKAEAAGQPHFVARVADVYLRGVRAVPMDVPRGTALLQEAADHGDVEAKAKLAALSTAK
jgi:TPR repeat protein